jgi:homoserine dehydrogenase
MAAVTPDLLDDGSSLVRVGVLGCGNVGGPLVRLIESRGDEIAARTGVRLEVTRIAVRDLTKDRGDGLDPSLLTTDARSIVEDWEVDIVIEVMGGIEPARDLILSAMRAGKPVITANKELLATAGFELFEAAEVAGVDLLFEAAVGGGIPIIRPLRESLVGEEITRVLGIVNGTTNFILTRMAESGASYPDALAEAQQLGYAEADPTADVEGFDAGAKVAIIASIAFGASVVSADVHHEGISSITPHDIESAARLGYVIKLLGVAEQIPATGEIGVRVHPAMVPLDHPLASVRESFNAVVLEGTAVGQLMFYGRGAGGGPTASAVLGDLVDAAVNRRKGSHASVGRLGVARLSSIDDVVSAYFLDLEVVDEPGVLAQVAGAFGRHEVSIRSMEQEGLGDEARLVFITHQAREAQVRATLHDLDALPAVRRIGSVLRVIGEG